MTLRNAFSIQITDLCMDLMQLLKTFETNMVINSIALNMMEFSEGQLSH